MTICFNCNVQNPNGTSSCSNCGADLRNAPAPQFTQAPTYGNAPQAPVARLKTNRSFVKFFFLSLITFGIYGIVQYYGITEDVNTVCTRYDNKHTMNYIVMCLLSIPTICILPLVWTNNICNRMGNELKRRNIDFDFSASTFWIFGFLLSFTVVCPIIFTVKFIKASNLLNESFNKIG